MAFRTLLRSVPVWALGFLLLACSKEEEPKPVVLRLEHIDCAVSDSPELTPACSVERTWTAAGLVLLVHHPDGGRRRFRVKADGSGMEAMDFAGPVTSRLGGGRLDVQVGPDRYVFPATVRSDAGE